MSRGALPTHKHHPVRETPPQPQHHVHHTLLEPLQHDRDDARRVGDDVQGVAEAAAEGRPAVGRAGHTCRAPIRVYTMIVAVTVTVAVTVAVLT